MKDKRLYTIQQGIKYASQYCAKAERTQKEVKSNLLKYGLNENESDEVIITLIQEGFINEQRYADLFTRSKLHQNAWGKIKIRQMLKIKGISDNCINNTFKNIDDLEYEKTLQKLFEKKEKTLKSEKNIFKKKAKIQAYLLSHGFEMEMIYKTFEENNL